MTPQYEAKRVRYLPRKGRQCRSTRHVGTPGIRGAVAHPPPRCDHERGHESWVGGADPGPYSAYSGLAYRQIGALTSPCSWGVRTRSKGDPVPSVGIPVSDGVHSLGRLLGASCQSIGSALLY